MADTNFINQVTVIPTAWLNDLNDFFYTTMGGLAGGGITAATARNSLGASAGLWPVSLGGTGASDAATARTNLGLGTISTQGAASVSITGGTITGITDLAIADGGTGASTQTGAFNAVVAPGGTMTGNITLVDDTDNLLNSGPIPHCGILEYISATQIKFSPFNGDKILIKVSSTWKQRDIPSAGITAANTSVFINGTSGQNLAASTVYDVCLFDNSGTLTFDFITPGRAKDSSTGVEIKTGDATRTYIGKIRTNASSQFQYTDKSKLVISWYNTKSLSFLSLSTSTSVFSAAPWFEFDSTQTRVDFLCFGKETVHAISQAAGTGSAAATNLHCAIGFNTATASSGISGINSNGGINYYLQTISSYNSTPAEGYHFLACLVGAATGTITPSAGYFGISAIVA